MEWLDRFNRALDYIEDHLTQAISYDEAARIACCSTYHYQRMFSYIAGVPLSEYIRRRRMTLAAFRLQQTNAKVVDLALEYGYDSPTAFTRAFHSIHGVVPSAARKAGIALNSYPRITFHITIKGDAKMDYRIEQKGAFRVMGVKAQLDSDMEKNFQSVPAFWLKVAQTDTIPVLLTLMDTVPKGVLGVCGNTDDNRLEYYIAVASTRPLPDDRPEFSAYTIPASTWAVFPGRGVMPDAIQRLERRMITEWLPTSGYEYANLPDIEVYLNEDSQDTQFEVWMPIVKKA